MKTIINIAIITACIILAGFCGYKLITAECSIFNYLYLLGIAISAMIGGDRVAKNL